jgi:hypothetical protein
MEAHIWSYGAGKTSSVVISIWMPTEHIVALLIAERDKLNRAIEALQGRTKPLGRRLKNHVPETESDTTNQKKKRHVSATARRRMAAAQKKRWAAAKAAKAISKPKRTSQAT